VGHGGRHQSQRRAWLRLAAIYSAGLVVSAGAFGAVLATLACVIARQNAHPSYWASWGLRGMAVLALIYLPRQLGWTRFPMLLQSTRQVPEAWKYKYPAWATALLFGLGLGSGCYTRIVVPTFYLLMAWPFLFSGFFWPVMIWSCYGLARSALVWRMAWAAPKEGPLSLAFRLIPALQGRSRLMHKTHAAILLMAAAWLVTWSLWR